MAEQLKPIETQWFTAQKNRAKQAFTLGNDQNTYERGLSNVQSGWSREDMIRNFNRQREGFANSWNKRGMVNSGLYNAALTRFQGDQQTNLTRQRTGNEWKNQGYDIAGNQLATIQSDALQELEDQRRAYQNTMATVLRGYQ